MQSVDWHYTAEIELLFCNATTYDTKFFENFVLARIYAKFGLEHHKRLTFKEELVELLEKAGIEYDNRYLWD